MPDENGKTIRGRGGSRTANLAAVADAARDEAGAGGHEQLDLPPAWRAKFNGMSMDSMDEARPQIGETWTFQVTATCDGYATKRMKDGEIRHVSTFVVDKVIVTAGRATEAPGADAATANE